MKYINLLPKPKQQELRFESIFHSVLILIEISAVICALIFAGQLLTKVYLRYTTSALAGEIELIKKATNKEEYTQLKSKIKIINNQIVDYNALANANPKFSKVLRAFSEDVPDEVKINSFMASTEKKKIDISGFSPSREAVIILYNNINQDTQNFYNIDYPLENVSKPADVAFHFTFYIKDELLK